MIVLDEAEVIERVRSAVLTQFPDTHLLVLFGSRAREEAEPDSDYDFLVVTPTEERYAWRGAKLRLAVRPIDAAFDFIVLTPEEYEASCALPWSVAVSAVKEGRVLHAVA